jgi:hypothetical protein
MEDEGAVEKVGVGLGLRRPKTFLTLGIIVSAACFVFASRTFRVPLEPGFGGSLLSEPTWLVSLLVVAVTLVVAVLLSTLIAGTIRFDAGLFCATAGMVGLSGRCGHIGDVLRQSTQMQTPRVLVVLAVELVTIYALVAVAWSVLWGLHRGDYLKADEFRDGVEDTDEPLPFKVAALVMQVGVMALGVLLLAQVDAKAQVIIAVGASAFAGALAAYYMYPISPSPWLWTGPMIVGVAGYLLAYFNLSGGDDLWRTGQMTHVLAPLARPLPIDYASAGTAGAILGYWVGRKWHRERMAESTGATPAEVGAAGKDNQPQMNTDAHG